MKKLKYVLVALFIFFINFSIVSANEIYNINVDVKLDKLGNGHITETWSMNVSSKTEVYKALSHLGNSEISNFTASMDNEPYTYQKKWNVNASLAEKAYKNGIYYENGDTELCWGMTKYGKHNYTITYDVSNMIYNVEDAQVLYWRFMDNGVMDPDVKTYNVTVSGPDTYKDTLDVWGYGKLGAYTYVKDGKIQMTNPDNQQLNSSEYVVLLTKFPVGTFDTTNESTEFSTFNDFLSLAEQGSVKYNSYKETFWDKLVSIFVSLFQFFICAIVALGVFIGVKKSKYIKKEIDYKNLNNFRDIPCNKDIYRTFFLCDAYGFNKKKEDLFGAVLLKWLLEKRVTIVKEMEKKLIGEKEVTSIKFEKGDDLVGKEKELYDYMYEASQDGLLQQDEMEKWSKTHYSKLYNWFDEIISDQKEILIKEGHITSVKQGKVIHYHCNQLDDYLYDEAIKIAGLKKYLIEFSRIKEKQPIEVNLWEYYLIYAQIFGIAKQVAKQFKDLYPELVTKQENGSFGYGFDYYDIMWINSMTSSSVSAASSARAAAQSYSSGGGGFSSGGGGGGSFGGGGGGCR